MCQVQCKVGFDFGFTPPMMYLCSSGIWSPFGIPPYDSRLPWPDCSSEYEINFFIYKYKTQTESSETSSNN